MDKEKLLDFYIQKMRQFKLRITNIRIEIIKCLLKHEKWHTIDEIVEHLTEANREKPNVSSVYNTLHSFVQYGIVNAFLDTTNFKPCFNLKHDNHEHVYCFFKKDKSSLTMAFDKSVHLKINEFFKENNLKIDDYYVVATVNGMKKDNEKKKCE